MSPPNDGNGNPATDQKKCVLHDLQTEKPAEPKDVEQYWQTGEWDVTGALPRRSRRSKESLFLAYDDALDKALEHFSDKYECVGHCGEDRICNLAVRVLRTKGSRLVRRKVPTDPESFQFRRLGIREVERVYLQVQVFVTCECECVVRPPVTSGKSGVESDMAFSATGIVSFDD